MILRDQGLIQWLSRPGKPEF